MWKGAYPYCIRFYPVVYLPSRSGAALGGVDYTKIVSL
jgi:hypothetical protein